MGTKLKAFIPSLGKDTEFQWPYSSIQMDHAHMLFARASKSMKAAHAHYCKFAVPHHLHHSSQSHLLPVSLLHRTCCSMHVAQPNRTGEAFVRHLLMS
jgi:hypothetical protein